MRKELDKLLCDTFPNLYKDRYASMEKTNMCWGFPGTGWFLIIWNLSEKLEDCILQMPEDIRGDYCAAQVKEKFGTLRFSLTKSTPEMVALIRFAQALSASTCEECGAPGQLRMTSWRRTLCDLHGPEKTKDELE